ncbi:MAG: aryl-sulfate sulfotransferase, partial [Ignavibacteriaceae bacterium]
MILSPGNLSRAQTFSDILLDYPQIAVDVNINPSDDFLFLGLTALCAWHLLILDNEVTPVFYKKVEGTIFNFLRQENGELTYNIYPDSSFGLDSSGTIVNKFFTPDSFAFDFHELTVLEDGTYYILGEERVVVDLSHIVPGGQTNATLITQNIHHIDDQDNEIWRWRSFDHYDILDADSAVNLTQSTINWSHCNSIKVDYDGNILLSTRNFNEVTKINRQSGEIIWRLGGERNQFQFINDSRGFARQHDAKRNAAGNLILFDNGVRLEPQYSSLVEYALDEDSLTATLVRRFSRNETVWSRIRGGVQGLPNGNHLISWGESDEPAVTEINSDNEIVYELSFPNGGHRYRSFRFPWKTNYFSVNRDSVNFGIVDVGDSASSNLTLYNYREEEVTINEIFYRESSFSVKESLPITIPNQDSVEIVIMFKPYSDEYYTDKINFRYVNDTLLLAQQVFVEGVASLVSVEEDDKKPEGFYLSQNYPNPFNPGTTIRYSVPTHSNVKLRVYHFTGGKIADLINADQNAGSYEVSWVAENIASGIYLYSIESIPSD